MHGADVADELGNRTYLVSFLGEQLDGPFAGLAVDSHVGHGAVSHRRDLGRGAVDEPEPGVVAGPADAVAAAELHRLAPVDLDPAGAGRESVGLPGDGAAVRAEEVCGPRPVVDACDAELVTDDAAALRVQLQAATGEGIAALDGVGEMNREALDNRMPPRLRLETAAERCYGPAQGMRSARSRTGWFGSSDGRALF